VRRPQLVRVGEQQAVAVEKRDVPFDGGPLTEKASKWALQNSPMSLPPKELR